MQALDDSTGFFDGVLRTTAGRVTLTALGHLERFEQLTELIGRLPRAADARTKCCGHPQAGEAAAVVRLVEEDGGDELRDTGGR
jgi:hypothetical protein